MIPAMDLPGVLTHEMFLEARMSAAEKDRRIRYARHELFLKMGDDIPDDVDVVLKATTERLVMTEMTMEKGAFWGPGDERVRLRIHVRKLEQE